MQPLFTIDQIQSADQHTIQELQIPETTLMEHAALAIAERLRNRFGTLLPKTKGLILAGAGNNGGDALALARILQLNEEGDPTIVLLADKAKLSASAALQYEILTNLSTPIEKSCPKDLQGFDWIVDGIFGTGLARPVEGRYGSLIRAINEVAGKKWVISIDIPSGLCANTGQVLGVAIHASETLCLGFLKRGLVTGCAANHVGQLHLSPIQIPRQIPGIRPSRFLFERGDAKAWLPHRRPSGHKGDYGHVYVWAGVDQTQGAGAMACLSALKTGAGLATLIGEISESMQSRLPPEVMTLQAGPEYLMAEEEKAQSTLVIGPGMGTTEEKWTILEKALQSTWPMVLDADALTLISSHREAAAELLKSRPPNQTVLTPHPKEASRLLDLSAEEVQANRYEAVKQLAIHLNSCVVLKGSGTLTARAEGPRYVVSAGNTALSKGGSGDVLTGIIAGLLAQKLSAIQAATLGAYLHGTAAELATQRLGTERTLLAGELAQFLPAVFSLLEK